MPTEMKQEPVKLEETENPLASREGIAEKKVLPGSSPAEADRPALEQAPVPVSPGHRRIQMTVMAISLIACFAIGGGLLIARKLHRSGAVALQPTVLPIAEGPLSQSGAPSNGPYAPGVVATEEELAKPWSSKRFTYHDPIIGTDVPAMVVHLPNGSYWGFSLLDPVHDCQLEYITDPDRLQSFYHFHTDHPMVGDPCNFAVFDLLQYSGPKDAEVRGAPMNAIGVRAPIAIEIEQKGDQILATEIE